MCTERKVTGLFVLASFLFATMVNAILRKESRNMRLSIECKTLFVNVWDAVMKLTAVGKYYFSSDIRNFKNIKSPLPSPFSLLHTLFKDECMCLQDE